MPIASFNDMVVQIHKHVMNDNVFYYAKLFRNHQPCINLILEYTQGEIEIKKGKSTDREKELLIHCIQVMVLSGSFDQ